MNKVEESIMSYLSQSEMETSPKDLNVVAMLHNFWERRQMSQSKSSSTDSDGSVGEAVTQSESLVLYESAPPPGPPYICYVTLPGGSCFGNYKVCGSQAEARRDAARVALMNSLVNELPCRRITLQFISQSLKQAATDSAVSIEDACDSSTSIGTYSLLLHTYIGRTMLEFQLFDHTVFHKLKRQLPASRSKVGTGFKDLFKQIINSLEEMMTIFQLLHWNGTLKVLRERQCSRQSVIAYYSQRGLDEYIRSSLALDWLGREQRSPGRLGEELQVAQRELVLARRRGMELRFYKEKTEILSLALSQAYIHHTLEDYNQVQSNTYEQQQLSLQTLCSQDADDQVTPPCSPTQSPHKHTKLSVCQTSGKHTPQNSPSLCSQEFFLPLDHSE